MISVLLSRAVITVGGTLYPAYRSYKAVKTKDTREYVKWMMYWIVFALFCVVESIADVFVSFWFPFYYEMKILLVFWLISPWTKGASILYRKRSDLISQVDALKSERSQNKFSWIHPMLLEHESEIDTFLEQAKSESYKRFFELGSRGLTVAREIVATAALRGIMAQQENLRRSLSMDDVNTARRATTTTTVRVREILREEDHLVKAVDPSAPPLDEDDDLRPNEHHVEDGERLRTWTGTYDDTGRIIEHSVAKINGEEMVIVEESAMGADQPRRSHRRSRSRGRSDEPSTLPRRSARNSANSESGAHNSK